jgi:hypothetical protein
MSSSNPKEQVMKKIMLASTVILAVSAGGAFAQTQPNDNGPASNGNVGPGTTSAKSTGAMKHNSGAGMTTGAARGNAGGDSSASGNVGPGTSNNKNKSSGR